MAAIIGLIMLGAASVLITHLSPWYLRYRASRPVLTEAVSYVVIGFGVTGVCLIFGAPTDALHSHDLREIATTHGTVLLGVPALVLLCRWLNRVQTRRQRSVPVAVPAE